MEVVVKNVSVENNPLTYLGKIAGTCTGKEEKGNARKRALSCLENGHLSVFEHISFTWDVQGVSRSLTHQLVRHRIASFTQQSQRYVKMEIDPYSQDWYVMPPTVEFSELTMVHPNGKTHSVLQTFKDAMTDSAIAYRNLLEVGIPAEDARYVLPNAMKTNIVVTMNLREFMHFHRMRADHHAQWEIRSLAEEMLSVLHKQLSEDEEWNELLLMIVMGDV